MRTKRLSPSSREWLRQVRRDDRQLGTWSRTKLLHMEHEFFRAMAREGHEPHQEQCHDSIGDCRERR
jgi:hypothetical protein